MNKDRWKELMQSLGFSNDIETYQALYRAYSEKHRHYHTINHITDCLAKLDSARYLASEVAEVEIAIWFHDAVYKPLSSSNERNSADWAKSFLLKQGADNKRVERVHQLIMATLHNAPASSKDAMLLVDIDLYILGAEKEAYQQFEKDVRKEYKWVPYFLYRKRRSEILDSFLKRERIFSNEYFYEYYEQTARMNLKTAVSMLRGNA